MRRNAIPVSLALMVCVAACRVSSSESGTGAETQRVPFPDDSVLVIAAVGDIMMGSTFPEGSPMPPMEGDSLFLDVKDVLQAADIAFGNLEGPLIDGGKSAKCGDNEPNCYAFRTPTRYVRHLVAAGFDLLSIANNHALDFGIAGRASTIRALDSAGLRWSGPPGTMCLIETRGRRVAMIAFSYNNESNDIHDLDAARGLVATAVQNADLVIVSFHGGAEGSRHQHVPGGEEIAFNEKRGSLREFAHAMVDAGADLLLGHGPHVMRGMEVYKNRLIAYSLGNFVTYAMFNLNGPNGITCILETRLAPDGAFLGGRLHPVKQIKPGGALRDSAGTVISIVRDLSREDFPQTGVVVDEQGRLRKP